MSSVIFQPFFIIKLSMSDLLSGVCGPFVSRSVMQNWEICQNKRPQKLLSPGPSHQPSDPTRSTSICANSVARWCCFQNNYVPCQWKYKFIIFVYCISIFWLCRVFQYRKSLIIQYGCKIFRYGQGSKHWPLVVMVMVVMMVLRMMSGDGHIVIILMKLFSIVFFSPLCCYF